MKIWFTSDTHFGHKNILEYCNRPFSSIEEHDEELIKRWNEKVQPTDFIWHLGDFCFGKRQFAESIFTRLQGYKMFIPGNHDRNRAANKLDWYAKYNNGITLPFKNILLKLSHYQPEEWELVSGVTFLHGHAHGRYPRLPNRIDVGVDCWNYYPVSIEEVIKCQF